MVSLFLLAYKVCASVVCQFFLDVTGRQKFMTVALLDIFLVV